MRKMNDKGAFNANSSGNLYNNASSSHETNGLSAQKTSKINPTGFSHFRVFSFAMPHQAKPTGKPPRKKWNAV